LLRAVGEVDVVDWPMPEPRGDELLVRVDAVGICGSDVHYFRHGRIGSFVLEAPLVLGHETAGTVVEVGEAVGGSHRVGDRVAIEPGVPCGRCRQCRAGRYNLCPDVEFHGTPPVHGTLQRFVAVRSDFAYRLPEGVAAEEGALVEPLAVALWACRKACVGPGSAVLITGVGPVGLLVAQVARAMGAARVVVTDPSEHRRKTAMSLGADEALEPDDLAGDGQAAVFDAHIECSGSAAAARDALRWLAPLGSAVLVGMGSSAELSMSTSLVQERELRVTGTFRYAGCYPDAIALLAAGRVKAAELVTARFPLSDTAAALQTVGEPGALKCLVLPNT
jgi:L-iditol 2-dehydrogenase